MATDNSVAKKLEAPDEGRAPVENKVVGVTKAGDGGEADVPLVIVEM